METEIHICIMSIQGLKTNKGSDKKYKYFLFLVISFIAIFFRFYNLSSVPPSASLDEASIGYNAYSILKTGADEYGTKFPLLLRAYDDWRPALYVYLVIPLVKIFGLNVLAVRLPSAILSILTVIVTYFLTKELFKNVTIKQFNNQTIALFTSFLLAVSPWHIYISRLGHEVNASLAFWVFGLFLFFKGNNKNILIFSWQRVIYYSFSSLFFALSFGSYQSAKLFIPAMVFILVLLYSNDLIKRKKELLIPCIIGILISFPTLQASLQPNALIRLQGTNIFSVESNRYYQESILLKKAIEEKNIIGEVLHNRRVLTVRIFLEQYTSHFNPWWLFANVGKDNHKAPGVGLFYPWEALCMFFGFIFLVKEKFLLKIKLFLLFWILIAPLPAAITTDAPHALRTYSALPAPQIVAALGVYYIYFLGRKYSKALFTLSCIIIIVTIFYFTRQYFVVFPKEESSSFQYALSQAIPFVLSHENRYNKVVFSNRENLYQSYMFFLFNSRYDPQKYQKEGGTISGGFAEIHKFGKYEFRPIKYSSGKTKTLLVGNVSDFPSDKKPLYMFANLDKQTVIEIIEK